MKTKLMIAGAIAAAAAMSAQPANAYELRTTGRTLASPQLVVDTLRTVARHSKMTGGCSFLFSAHMEVMPPSYRPAGPAIGAVAARGGHYEMWTVNACAAKQRFQIAMWPSPRGGTDFAVVALTGRMPLYVK